MMDPLPFGPPPEELLAESRGCPHNSPGERPMVSQCFVPKRSVTFLGIISQHLPSTQQKKQVLGPSNWQTLTTFDYPVILGKLNGLM